MANPVPPRTSPPEASVRPSATLGSYAINRDQITVLRIEKDHEDGYVLRHRRMGGDHPWRADAEPLVVFALDEVQTVIPEAEGCVLRGSPGMFVRIDDPERSETGYILMRSDESRLSVTGLTTLDLYRKSGENAK